MAKLGRGLERLGELLAPARDAVGRVLIDIGYKIHSLLCAPPPAAPAAPRLLLAHAASCRLLLASVFRLCRAGGHGQQSRCAVALPLTPLSRVLALCLTASGAGQTWQSMAKSACCVTWQADYSMPCSVN